MAGHSEVSRVQVEAVPGRIMLWEGAMPDGSLQRREGGDPEPSPLPAHVRPSQPPVLAPLMVPQHGKDHQQEVKLILTMDLHQLAPQLPLAELRGCLPGLLGQEYTSLASK